MRGIASALSAALVAASLVALPAPALASAPAQTASTAPAGMRILVRFSVGASAAARAAAVASVGGWIENEMPAIGVTRIALPGGADDAFGDGPAVAAVLAKDPAIASAEFDGSVRVSFDPTDTYWLNDPYVGLGQWGARKASVDKAWDTARGSPNVTVAVLDTGVDAAHPDLAGALVPGNVFVSQPSSECVAGTANDDNSHGTHVAGVIGATGNNSSGIAGIAFGVKVMAMKVLDCTGVGSLSDVANGIIWAADHGARVINLSLGSPFDSSTLRSAVSYAGTKNALVVSAVGNCGTSGDRCTTLNQVEYPAAYADVLAVGATDTDDSVAFFSTRNSTVQVSAPGRRIVSTTPTYATYLSRTANATRTYASFSGTSQASPFVAGLAALMLSADPTLTGAQVADRIKATADDLGPAGRDDGYGLGRVNALRAINLTTLRQAPAPTPSPAVATATYGATYALGSASPILFPGGRSNIPITLTNTGTATWTATGSAPVRLAAHVTDSKGAVAIWDGTRTLLVADVAPGVTVTTQLVIDAPLPPGPYRIRADLVREGVAWFSSLGVRTGDADLLVAPDTRASIPGTALTVSRANPTTTATITNQGIATWTPTGAAPINVSVHWFDGVGKVLVWDGPRTPLPRAIAPNESFTLAVDLGPVPAGAAFVSVDLVSEGVTWFGQGSLRQVTLSP